MTTPAVRGDSRLVDRLLMQLEEWRAQDWPKNGYVFGTEGKIYCRWTPAFEGQGSMFTIAKVEINKKLRGRGFFKEILETFCATDVFVIRLECIQNPRLAEFADRAEYPGRSNIEFNAGLEAGNLPPTIDWIINDPKQA